MLARYVERNDVNDATTVLSDFDHFMAVQGTDRHPMEFCFRLELSSRIDPTVLERAANDVARRHFRLTAGVETERWPFRWNVQEHHPVTIARHLWGEVPEILNRSCDFRAESGVRISLADSAVHGKSECWFWFQHVRADGRSAVSFMNDVLLAAQGGQGPIEAENSSFPLMTQRPVSVATRLRWAIDDACRTVMFLARKPIILDGGRSQASQSSSSRPVRRISQPLTCRIVPRDHRPADQRHLTVNDVILGCVFRTVAKWHMSNSDHDSRWIRMAVPIDQRSATAGNARMVMNDVSLLFLDRRVAEVLKSPATFFNGIHREMQFLRQHCTGSSLQTSLFLLRSIPSLLCRLVKCLRFATTVLVSNLGPVAFCDGASDGCESLTNVEQVQFFPPLRAGTSISLGVLSHDGRLQLSLSYDADRLTDEQAWLLVEQIQSEMETAVGHFEDVRFDWPLLRRLRSA